MAEEFKPKPTWNQSYFFPEEQFSFMGWGSKKQHLTLTGFSEPKTTGSADTFIKSLGAIGFIFTLFHPATMEESGAIGDMPEVEGYYPFSDQRPAPEQAVLEEFIRDVGCDK